MSRSRTAVVVGSGPNGLAAAYCLASHDFKVVVIEASSQLGGGARSYRDSAMGVIHDSCAAIHPMAPSSPFSLYAQLETLGVRWLRATIDCAHPLDRSAPGMLYRSADTTGAGLGIDGRMWRALFGGGPARFERAAEDLFRPILAIPRHPLELARFGGTAAVPPSMLMKVFRSERARALFMGVAAHAIHRLDRPFMSAIGAGIILAGHANGWPVVEGGTGNYVDALVGHLKAIGTEFVTGTTIRSYSELPSHELLMLDVDPVQAAKILEQVQPAKARSAYLRFQRGGAAFKYELALEGGIPWRDQEISASATVHIGGSAAEIIGAEHAVALGKMPERPFVLVGQQYVADPSRRNGMTVPIDMYAHVPNGYQGDPTDLVFAQIERFAPGFRSRILSTRALAPYAIESKNPNFTGGDILTGQRSSLQTVFGPRITSRPYDTGVPGAFLCSAATPPGAGIHGMAGFNAAKRAIMWISGQGGK